MKNCLFILLLLPNAASCFAQSLFFDNLKNSAWTTDESLDASMIGNLKQISLIRLKIPEDSLKTNRTIWKFDDQLVIRHYDAGVNKDSLIAKCGYAIDRDKGRLTIIPNAGRKAKFDIAIESTASLVLLIRRKK
jgi:hypothetical protein